MSNSHFDNLINFNYLNTLLSIVKDKYSNILYDIIKSLLYPEPEIRKSILSLYEETLKNVEEYILNFDDKWVNSADRLLSYEIPSLPQESQEICSNWLIYESRTMLSRLDSKLEWSLVYLWWHNDWLYDIMIDDVIMINREILLGRIKIKRSILMMLYLVIRILFVADCFDQKGLSLSLFCFRILDIIWNNIDPW